MSKWSIKEEKFLKENYAKIGLKKCSERLNRSIPSVQSKARNLKLIDKSRQILTGLTFGYLYVESLSESKGNKRRWNCICKCGKAHKASTNDLKNGHIKSCGCYKVEVLKKIKYTGGEYICGDEFSGIRNNAKNRKYLFEITIQDIEEVYKKQNKKCRFTGENLYFNKNSLVRGNASVDRIDSNKGYTKDNIQIVHKDINIAKQSKSDKDFIDMCCRVADHHRNK